VHAVTDLRVTATSVAVERVSSQGQILLSHMRNRLLPQTTRALMCLGDWSQLGLVHDSDVLAVTLLPDVVSEGGDAGYDIELKDGWDSINLQ
jgi:hypothetical protein